MSWHGLGDALYPRRRQGRGSAGPEKFGVKTQRRDGDDDDDDDTASVAGQIKWA